MLCGMRHSRLERPWTKNNTTCISDTNSRSFLTPERRPRLCDDAADRPFGLHGPSQRVFRRNRHGAAAWRQQNRAHLGQLRHLRARRPRELNGPCVPFAGAPERWRRERDCAVEAALRREGARAR